MTRTRPLRRMILHFSHIGFTDGLTFMCPFGLICATWLWLPFRLPLHTRSKSFAHGRFPHEARRSSVAGAALYGDGGEHGFVPRREDPRAVRGDGDGELEMGRRASRPGSRSPSRRRPSGRRGGRRWSSARWRGPCPPRGAGRGPASRSWGSAAPRASSARSRGRPASGSRRSRRPRRGPARRGRCPRGGCRARTARRRGTATRAWRPAACAPTGLISPTGNVIAPSATQPSLVTPTSTLSTSPRLSLYGPGMPWTTMWFGRRADGALEARGSP